MQASRPSRTIKRRGKAETRCNSKSTDAEEFIDAMLPRKAAGGAVSESVPQTDTGRQVENTKALERTLVKELCKLTP